VITVGAVKTILANNLGFIIIRSEIVFIIRGNSLSCYLINNFISKLR